MSEFSLKLAKITKERATSEAESALKTILETRPASYEELARELFGLLETPINELVGENEVDHDVQVIATALDLMVSGIYHRWREAAELKKRSVVEVG